MADITQDMIQEALRNPLKGHVLEDLSEEFRLERYENGNFQVTLANMGQIRDFSKICILKEACERLHAAELIPHPDEIFRLSWKTRKVDEDGAAIYRPYPTIWVNQPGRTEAAVSQNTEELTSVRAELAQLKTLLAKVVPQDKKTSVKKAPAPKKSTGKKVSKKAVSVQPSAAPPEGEQGEEVPFGF